MGKRRCSVIQHSTLAPGPRLPHNLTCSHYMLGFSVRTNTPVYRARSNISSARVVCPPIRPADLASLPPDEMADYRRLLQI